MVIGDIQEVNEMLMLRRAGEIYDIDGGRFHAQWHFSFDGYGDPEQMGVGALRVFNDDRITAGAEWPMHPHQHIESLTYVVEGDFLHADSLGNNGALKPGAAQVMTFSGRGDQHSERKDRPQNRCGSSSSGFCRVTRTSAPPCNRGSTRRRTGPTVGCRSWALLVRTAWTSRRTPGRSWRG